MQTLRERIHAVTARTRAFLAAREPGHLLVVTTFPVDAPPLRPLNTFDLERQLGGYLDERLAAARPGWAAKQGLDDDSLPAICPSFGIAEHTAWLGLDVKLQEWTCLPEPIIRGPADLERLQPDPSAPWFRRMRDGYAHLRGRQDGSFLLGVRGTMTPMDMANAVRGDDLVTDVLLEPEFVHALLKRLTALIPWYYDQLVCWSDEVDGGRVLSGGQVWLPAPCIGHLSNDAALLCGPDVYSAFGFPYEAELVGRYGRAMYHVHNQRMHFVPELARLPGLSLLEVSHDPKTVAPIDDLPRIFGATGNARLLLHATSDQVRARIGELASRNVLLDVRCRDRADAEDVVALVRSRSTA